MSNYNQSNITNGSVYTRSYHISLEDPLSGIPSVSFNEENVIEAGTATYTSPTGNPPISVQMTDPSVVFNLINPQDGTTVLGQCTYEQVYVMIYSLYLSLAQMRDAGTLP